MPSPFNLRATLETILVRAGKSPHLLPQKQDLTASYHQGNHESGVVGLGRLVRVALMTPVTLWPGFELMNRFAMANVADATL